MLFSRELEDIFQSSKYTKLENIILPECKCPRPFVDALTMIESYKSPQPVPDNLCYGPLNTTTSRYTGTYQGKWTIFTSSGWMSDFVDEATIIITTTQSMLVRNAVMSH